MGFCRLGPRSAAFVMATLARHHTPLVSQALTGAYGTAIAALSPAPSSPTRPFHIGRRWGRGLGGEASGLASSLGCDIPSGLIFRTIKTFISFKSFFLQ